MVNNNINPDEFEDFEDLLAGTTRVAETPVPKKEVSVPQPKPKEVKQAPKQETPSKQEANVEEDIPEGVGTVSFGTKISNVPIERFKGQKDYKARIAILSKQIQTVKFHYQNGIGAFLCFGGKCCELEGLPKVRYLVPIVQYMTDKNGKVVGQDLELKVLAMGSESYSALVDTIEVCGRDVTDVDLIVSCTEEQYQKLTFSADGVNKCSWKTFPGARDLVAKFKADRDKLYMAIGRRISEQSYLSKKGFITTPAGEPTQTFAAVTSAENLDDLLAED